MKSRDEGPNNCSPSILAENVCNVQMIGSYFSRCPSISAFGILATVGPEDLDTI